MGMNVIRNRLVEIISMGIHLQQLFIAKWGFPRKDTHNATIHSHNKCYSHTFRSMPPALEATQREHLLASYEDAARCNLAGDGQEDWQTQTGSSKQSGLLLKLHMSHKKKERKLEGSKGPSQP